MLLQGLLRGAASVLSFEVASLLRFTEWGTGTRGALPLTPLLHWQAGAPLGPPRLALLSVLLHAVAQSFLCQAAFISTSHPSCAQQFLLLCP